MDKSAKKTFRFCASLKTHFNDHSLMIIADVEQPAVERAADDRRAVQTRPTRTSCKQAFLPRHRPIKQASVHINISKHTEIMKKLRAQTQTHLTVLVRIIKLEERTTGGGGGCQEA